jgi:hypothetical protein
LISGLFLTNCYYVARCPPFSATAEIIRVQAMTTIDDELKALDEAYLKQFKHLFGVLFEHMAAKDADALEHFDNGRKLLREARGYVRDMITGEDQESVAHRIGPTRAERKKKKR